MVILSMVAILQSTFVLPGRSDYLLDQRIPGIVEGSAKMVDTEGYFTAHQLQTSTILVDLVCNNSDNLEIAVGYKRPTEELQKVVHPLKERVIWSGQDNFPSKSSVPKEMIGLPTDTSRILKEWNLFELGFTPDDYVKADERIWYLRIKDTSGGPYGYERNVTIENDGSVMTVLDYIPHMNYLDTFELSFNRLIFKTLLHPFFDGSGEIVIPIRGVHHELNCRDKQIDQEILGQRKANSWSTTTGDYGNTFWCVVFATQRFDNIYDGSFPDCRPNVLAARTFIKGTYGVMSRHPDGILDYGWNIAYCMDGDKGNSTDMWTVAKTDESYLKNMLTFVDGKLGSLGRLIVYVHSHGSRAVFGVSGNHVTLTTNSKWRAVVWTNVMTTNNYYDYIEAITAEGTHVFLWVQCCHGNGLDNWDPSDHHYCLEVWSYRPKSHSQGPNKDPYDVLYWYRTFDYFHTDWPQDGLVDSELEMFFSGAEAGPCETTVSSLHAPIKSHYDAAHSDTNDKMYYAMYWGNHIFYIDWVTSLSMKKTSEKNKNNPFPPFLFFNKKELLVHKYPFQGE